MPKIIKVNKTGQSVKTVKPKAPITNKGKIIKTNENYRLNINEVRKQIESIKQNKNMSTAQKELALKILRGKVKLLLEKIEQSKSKDPKIEEFKERTKKAFNKS